MDHDEEQPSCARARSADVAAPADRRRAGTSRTSASLSCVRSGYGGRICCSMRHPHATGLGRVTAGDTAGARRALACATVLVGAILELVRGVLVCRRPPTHRPPRPRLRFWIAPNVRRCSVGSLPPLTPSERDAIVEVDEAVRSRDAPRSVQILTTVGDYLRRRLSGFSTDAPNSPGRHTPRRRRDPAQTDRAGDPSRCDPSCTCPGARGRSSRGQSSSGLARWRSGHLCFAKDRTSLLCSYTRDSTG